ncbi:MAG: hypothetical protein WCV91_04235 [Candidatus Margulisiibacteriota bacterium]
MNMQTVPSPRKKENWPPTKSILPFIIGQNMGEDVEQKELAKLDLFEKGLENGLLKEETIEEAVEKVVKMAIAAEFGPSLVAGKGSVDMVRKITRAILAEPKLRQQALIIIDRFTK